MEEEVIIPEEPYINKMRYILNNEGYVQNISFGAEISCSLGTCTEYVGEIPNNYSTLEEWFDEEIERLNAWKIVDGNLVFDELKYNEHKSICEIQEKENATATNKYVNDRFNQVNDVVVDELADNKEGIGTVKLIDSGNYDISSLKIYLEENTTKVQVKVTNNNLIKNEVVAQEISGVNVIVNEDKTMVLDGTAEKDIYIALCGTNENTDMLFTVKSNTNYYQGGLLNGTKLLINSYNGEERTQVSNIENGLINVSEDYVVTEVMLYIAAGTTFLNSKIYPMFAMSDEPEQYNEHEENELLDIQLPSIKKGDYLNIANNEVSLVSGKREKQILELKNNLKSFTPTTLIMVDGSYNIVVDYYRDKYLTNTLNEIKSDLDGVSILVEENLQSIKTVTNKNILYLPNAFSPSRLLELRIKGKMSLFYLGENSYLGEDTYVLDSYLIQDTSEELTENAIKYHLPLNYLLYYDENNYDEMVITPEQTEIIRRVGENADGSLYILENEKIESYDAIEIPMFDGDNYLYLEHFLTEGVTLTANYEIKNNFNESYAKKAELKLTEESINAEVSKKVANNEVIARINMAIQGIDENEEIPEDVEKSIIEILANKISIKSDNFELTKDGVVTAKAGDIAGLKMLPDVKGDFTSLSKGSMLKKSFSFDDENYESGLYIPNDNDSYAIYQPFLFAGKDPNGSLQDSDAFIRHNGAAYFKHLSMIKDGSFSIKYESGKYAMQTHSNNIIWQIDNEENSEFATLTTNIGETLKLGINCAYWFSIRDDLHNKILVDIGRCDADRNAITSFYTDLKVWGNRQLDSVNNSIYIQGYEVKTTASDERLKENIANCVENALDIINKIPIVTFDWKKDTHRKDAGKHIRVGYGAQRTQAVYEDAVIYDEENDTYQMDLLNISALHTKAIQELTDKITKQQKIIEFLVDKLDCKEELENYLKGEKE